MDEQGLEDSAIFLMTLGEEDAAEVFKHLEPKEVQKLGETITKLKSIPRDRVEQVLARFNEKAANQTNLVLQNARRLKPLVTAEHIYWTNAGDARALALSRQNQQALDQLIATAAQGNADRTYNSALAFAASCSACHDNRPEQRVRIRN